MILGCVYSSTTCNVKSMAEELDMYRLGTSTRRVNAETQLWLWFETAAFMCSSRFALEIFMSFQWVLWSIVQTCSRGLFLKKAIEVCQVSMLLIILSQRRLVSISSVIPH
jgi:hypothetical protein